MHIPLHAHLNCLFQCREVLVAKIVLLCTPTALHVHFKLPSEMLVAEFVQGMYAFLCIHIPLHMHLQDVNVSSNCAFKALRCL